MKISFRKCNGLTLIEVLVIFTIVGLLTGLLLPMLQKPVKRGQRITCVNNLKQVGLSFRLWAGDNGENYPMQVSTNLGGTIEFAQSPVAFRHFQVLSNELGTPKVTFCPQDTNRTNSSNFYDFSNLNLSYFVAIDANETNANMVLSGDRHITNGSAPKNGMLFLMTNQNVRWSKDLHTNKNNIGFADGGVQQVSSKALKTEILVKTGFATNRIALP